MKESKTMEQEQIYRAFIDGNILVEYSTLSEAFAEKKCWEALKKALKNYPASIDPIDVSIECDNKRIAYEVLVYDFEEESYKLVF